jgi:hypothetical protein
MKDGKPNTRRNQLSEAAVATPLDQKAEAATSTRPKCKNPSGEPKPTRSRVQNPQGAGKQPTRAGIEPTKGGDKHTRETVPESLSGAR